MTQQGDEPNAKLTYKAPVLVHYGSVRNLTGGSAGRRNDGMGVMAAMMRMRMMGMRMRMMGMRM